jgi:hypothetical protein
LPNMESLLPILCTPIQQSVNNTLLPFHRFFQFMYQNDFHSLIKN